MSHILSFEDADSTSIELTGGKGSSLARLAQARFPVPGGFIVTTDAYSAFIAANTLDQRMNELLSGIDYDDGRDVEDKAQAIRDLIVAAPVPAAVVDEILVAYRSLGDARFVAVRSSGTAEDLAEASFAGQHDSYLDIAGEQAVVDAVRRCWASLWTARATAYRTKSGFDHARVRLAVVVQEMVPSDVSGVMFTANPMSTAVDEHVVNASWGLGEGIVSGILTPDQITIDRDTHGVKAKLLGSKEKRVVRDVSGVGTMEEPVPAPLQRVFSLTDEQAGDLSRLGARVTSFYGEWPQDIEWAMVGDDFYLLQSRDVTGVEFSWDEDLEDYVDLDRVPDDALLSRHFSDSVWGGRITPMGYSLRGEVFTTAVSRSERLWGADEVAKMRLWKYYKGEAYYNCQHEYENVLLFCPPMLRNPALAQWTAPSFLVDLEKKPGSWIPYVKALARIQMMDKDVGLYKWFDYGKSRWEDEAAQLLGPSKADLQKLSDLELRRAVKTAVENQTKWVYDIWTGFLLNAPFVSASFFWMLQNWYRGTNPMIFSDLITGLPSATITVRENLALWDFAETIRGSETMRSVYNQYEDGAFFEELKRHEEGRAFLAQYDEFLGEFGHRGHADRDVSHDRREEDPGIDYRTFGIFMSAEGEKPGSTEERLIAQREAAMDEALESIRRQPFGQVKAEMFKLVHDWLLRFFIFRDDQRTHTDRGTYAKKKTVQEVGRRLVERGVLKADDDYLYLSKNELMRLFEGATSNMRLTAAKVDARRRNCERYRKEFSPPMYLLGNGTPTTDGVDAESALGADGVLRGVGTSRGETVGTARVIAAQRDLDQVQKGDILVTHSTDPGWTTVFLILKGVVLETGGMLAHGSCISREYGIPAVQINDAMTLIPDGARISVNGETGEVRILNLPDGSPAPELAAAAAGTV
jgi:phosphohistidine swiveling domain-containing protein